MKRFLMFLTVALTAVSLLAATAEARRFGGGASFGKQRSFSQPPVQRAPAAGTSSAAPAKPAGQAQPPGNKWLGPLAGLALGAGLGALFAGGGLSGAMGGILLAILAAVVVTVLFARFRKTQPAMQPAMQYAASGAPDGGPREPGLPAVTGGAESTPAASRVPADFPVEDFLRNAKTSFIRLQTANDRKDLDDIREYTTPEMFAEIAMQIRERNSNPQKTDVLALNAEFVEVVTEGDHAIASVRLSGQLRENDGAPENFDEIWNVQKSLRDARPAWLLAGIQQVS